jgi:putative transposase
MKQQRAYQYRCYPTDEQVTILARTFGCARYVYNVALRLRTDAYYKDKKRIGYHETSAELTKLKHQPETAWLAEVASVPLQQALRHLDKAYHNFFEGRTRYPTFKKKHGNQAVSYVGTAFTLLLAPPQATHR